MQPLSHRFTLAVELAFGLHYNQTRKGTPVPYIGHLMAVCALVLDAGGDEDQAIAALLHDAVEDQGGLATLSTIRQLFGQRVADAVEACSDSTTSDPAQKPPWRERKQQYLAHLREASADALMVGVADKLHNARAILTDYRQVREQLWSRFKVGKAEQLWYYGELVKSFRATAAPKVLMDELERVVNDLITECGDNYGHAANSTAGCPPARTECC
jgi:(p)ppGpp synthase/HD superfamily hydrolase